MDKLLELIFTLALKSPWWVQIIVALVGGIVLLISVLRFVGEAEQGLKLRFGRVVRKRDGSPRIYHPGFMLLVPKIEKLVRRHVRQQTLDLKNQEIVLKDNSIFIISAVVFFRVRNIYSALFEVNDLDVAVKNFCMGVLRTTLQELNLDGIKDIRAVSEALTLAARSKFGEWGIELVEFRLVNSAPSRETAAFITASAAVRARKKALDDAGVQDPFFAAALLGVPAVASLQGATAQQQDGKKQPAAEEDV